MTEQQGSDPEGEHIKAGRVTGSLERPVGITSLSPCFSDVGV